jgi:hypothetical protein
MDARQCKKAGGVDSRPAFETAIANRQCNRESLAPQVARLRLTARCLNYSAVFVSDYPLVAEIFDALGRQVESWTWGSR